MSQLRRNVLTGEWVIISEERRGRPYHFNFDNHKEECPFCIGNEHMTPGQIVEYKNVRVVPNKYPIICPQDKLIDDTDLFYTKNEGTGYHEVVIETPLHDTALHELTKEQINNVFFIFKQRFVQLSKKKDIKYVQIFKNYGKNGGASLPHSHSQIVALPFIPSRLQKELETAKKHKDRIGTCICCDIIQEEMQAEKRILYHNDHVLVALAFAPRFAYETVLMPIKHQPDFGMVEEKVLASLADAFKNTVYLIKRAIGEFPYNIVLCSAPYKSAIDYYHWYLSLIPRISFHAGFEIATGTYTNSQSPEEAAKTIFENKK